jgi:hypothetical protein
VGKIIIGSLLRGISGVYKTDLLLGLPVRVGLVPRVIEVEKRETSHGQPDRSC